MNGVRLTENDDNQKQLKILDVVNPNSIKPEEDKFWKRNENLPSEMCVELSADEIESKRITMRKSGKTHGINLEEL